MNCALEFHDSRVASITSNENEVSLRFNAAYLHKSKGIPGRDAGTGWVQEAMLNFFNAEIEGSLDIGEGWMVDGTLTIGCESFYMLPVPFESASSVLAEFSFNNGCTVKIKATGVCLALL